MQSSLIAIDVLLIFMFMAYPFLYFSELVRLLQRYMGVTVVLLSTHIPVEADS